MTHLRLGGADVGLVGFLLAHSNLDGAGLAAVVHRGARTVGVDVKALTRLELGFFEGLLDGQTLCSAIGTRSRAMVGVA